MADALGTKRDSFGHVVKAGVPGFDDGKLSDNWARIILEGGANAAVAALTGGNPTVAGAATVAGKVASISAAPAIGRLSASIFKDDSTAITFGNALDNVLAGASGAAVGAAIGGHQGAWNGAVTASIIQQYNDTSSKDVARAVAAGRISLVFAAHMKQDEWREHIADATECAFAEVGSYFLNGKVNENNIPPKGYRLPTEAELREAGIDGYAGLAAMLHYPRDSRTGYSSQMNAALYVPKDPSNEHTPPLLVFQGTDMTHIKQDAEDVTQYAGYDKETAGHTANEYSPGQVLGQFFAHSKWSKTVVVGGNSMGGGIAIAVSRTAGLPAVATNPAAVNDNTYVFDKVKGHVDAVYMKGEFLHIVQDALHSVYAKLPASPVTNENQGISVSMISPVEEDRIPTTLPYELITPGTLIRDMPHPVGRHENTAVARAFEWAVEHNDKFFRNLMKGK
ncbi:hypothetical protein GM556_08490 [Bombella sp. ESL0378]|uniref:hypothetical protein n=1 Tax=Bombella sp. ESL0378 TaxID=2676442 RepID=UPI0013C5E2B3|nr:hypothetical protein [Bombella sp. ESL0378]MUG05570.1 hypothetical protein [Bombella sp. ESL0378]